MGFHFVNIMSLSPSGGFAFCWGFGKEGALGFECDSYSVPKQISKNKNAVKIICGNHCTFCIISSGQVYAWGKTSNGRLGVSSQSNIIKPTMIKSLNKIIKISCGEWHSLALSNQGNLFGWGKNNSGQLGSIDDKKIYSIHRVDISYLNIENNQEIISISCGFNFSFILFRNGSLYCTGNNSFGQLGNGTLNNSFQFCKTLISEEIVGISCGATHIGAITKLNNQVYMWGTNKYGELGLSKRTKPICTPRKLSFFENFRVIDISCSISKTYSHTLAVTVSIDNENDRKSWAWGCNYKSKLGLNNLDSDIIADDAGSFFSTPQLIPTLEGKNITKIVAGGIHSMALCDGQILSWGCGSDGRLGHPESDSHRYLFKEVLPRKIDSLSNFNVTDLSVSYYHSSCVAIEL